MSALVPALAPAPTLPPAERDWVLAEARRITRDASVRAHIALLAFANAPANLALWLLEHKLDPCGRPCPRPYTVPGRLAALPALARTWAELGLDGRVLQRVYNAHNRACNQRWRATARWMLYEDTYAALFGLSGYTDRAAGWIRAAVSTMWAPPQGSAS